MLMMTEHTEADTAVTATFQQSKYHVRYSTSNKAIAPLHTKSSTGIKGVRPLALKVFDHHILLILAKPILALIPIRSTWLRYLISKVSNMVGWAFARRTTLSPTISLCKKALTSGIRVLVMSLAAYAIIRPVNSEHSTFSQRTPPPLRDT
ncbi:hypothetical protein E3P77_02617 [Wallemia ichthyophaga]|nr:hypothetical protein E3P77_02617 [Wallemia ichthyophaga]